MGVEDIVYAHVLGMDALARGLRNAAALKQSGKLDDLIADRYASWHAKGGLGEKITKNQVGVTKGCMFRVEIRTLLWRMGVWGCVADRQAAWCVICISVALCC